MDEDLQIVKPVPNLINTENGVTVDLVGFFFTGILKKPHADWPTRESCDVRIIGKLTNTISGHLLILQNIQCCTHPNTITGS